MKILITGAAGFLGSHLYKALNNEHNVFAIDDMSGGKEENIKDLDLIQADCRNSEQMDRILSSITPDVIYHLAANAAENKAQFSPVDITSRNYSAFINVLTPAIKYGVKKFIFTSSIAVYGTLQTPFKESNTPKPEDLYGITKLAIEESLKVMNKVHGIEYVIVRPHNVYGPYQNMTDPYRNVVTIFMNSLLDNKPYYIYGDGEQKRCFTYMDDVTRMLVKCLELKNETINVGSDKFYTLNELSKTIQKVAGINIPPIYLPKRYQEVKEAISDHTIARKFGYVDSISLEEGLKKTWEWAKEQGYQEPKYDELEIISDKIPKNWIKP